MCGAHKQVYITHAWLFAASVTNTHAYTSTHTHLLWFIINRIRTSTSIQLNRVGSSCRIPIYSIWVQEQLLNHAHRHCDGLTHPLYTQTIPRIVNRCIRLEAPANTHSQKSLDKQPGKRKFQKFQSAISHILIKSNQLIKHITLTH